MGFSSVPHVFDYVLEHEPLIVVGVRRPMIHADDLNRITSFIIQVFDVDGLGIYVYLDRMNGKLKPTL
ncbi:MAG: hypothetical protein N3F04_07280 [Candidatus Nezhaarchaeota archaeon]|nr:hypothetical protein [Candidatus Nezhaarchaeota archaeon]MCX8142546.1 hypothetical protein [Candidatus Nezhaarchaeota archaeon]